MQFLLLTFIFSSQFGSQISDGHFQHLRVSLRMFELELGQFRKTLLEGSNSSGLQSLQLVSRSFGYLLKHLASLLLLALRLRDILVSGSGLVQGLVCVLVVGQAAKAAKQEVLCGLSLSHVISGKIIWVSIFNFQVRHFRKSFNRYQKVRCYAI